jgi:hypothetical protein
MRTRNPDQERMGPGNYHDRRALTSCRLHREGERGNNLYLERGQRADTESVLLSTLSECLAFAEDATQPRVIVVFGFPACCVY